MKYRHLNQFFIQVIFQVVINDLYIYIIYISQHISPSDLFYLTYNWENIIYFLLRKTT